MSITAIVLAAGEGTRMKSRHPKVMHKLLDRPLVSWVTRAARRAGAERIVVVVGHGADEVRAHLAAEKDVECVEQCERLGTGHAVRVALEQAGISEGTVLVLNGDGPLVEPETLRRLAALYQERSPRARRGPNLTGGTDDRGDGGICQLDRFPRPLCQVSAQPSRVLSRASTRALSCGSGEPSGRPHASKKWLPANWRARKESWAPSSR